MRDMLANRDFNLNDEYLVVVCMDVSMYGMDGCTCASVVHDGTFIIHTCRVCMVWTCLNNAITI